MPEITLQNFTKSELEEYIFPGTDAAVIFVANGSTLPEEVSVVHKRSGQQRWYPVTGGHLAKVPYHFAEGYESLFKREEKGWNHEHCDFCNASVGIGERCWTAPAGRGCYIFCAHCYDKLRDKRPWWKFWR